MALEQIEKCPLCAGTSFTDYLTCTDYTSSKKKFSLVRCTRCQLLITNPRPDKADIGAYYKSDTYISHTSSSKNLVDKIYLTARSYSLKRKRKLIEAYSPTGELLDYGCGTGAFIYECQRKGWSIKAIEPSADARIKAETLTGTKIASEISELSDYQFDVITLWHVLEHVHELDQTIKQLSSLLKPNGTIFIAVPNHCSWDAKNYQQHWAAYDVPRHLWHFSKDNISQLVNNNGMSVDKILPMKLDAYYVSLLSEQYKNPGQLMLTRYLFGFINGLRSNMKARKKNNFSSLIYIIKG